jgi:SLT domain-containing protein
MRVMIHVNQYKTPPQSRKSSGPGRATALADGGVVRATPGGINAVIAEGGRDERVTPLDRYGRSEAEVEMLTMMRSLMEQRAKGRVEVVNHIYPAPGMDERLLAEQVSKEIMFSKRRFA